MVAEADRTRDSRAVTGGTIPGAAHQPAFTLVGGPLAALPVLISVPHAGRAYPRYLLDRMRHPELAATRLEDRHADLLGEGVAAATGAMLLVAHAPRAMIDLNRAADDVDWEMFGKPVPAGGGGQAANRRARSGLGLIPRRLSGLGELWKRRHEEVDLVQRIEGVHKPYHPCIADSLERLRQRWGAALLLDLHSMPSLPPTGGMRGAELVLGDRFGAACHGGISARAFSHFAGAGRLAAHNRPYAGGYVLERHAQPARGIHALQLEVDRACYLDSQLDAPGPGLAGMIALLADLVRALGEEVAALGRAERRDSGPADWAEAAE